MNSSTSFRRMIICKYSVFYQRKCNRTERGVSKHSRVLEFERRTRSDRISGKKGKARENMQQATIGFRDKSICRRVKFADTSFVAVTFSTVLPCTSLFLVSRRCPRRHPSDTIAPEGISPWRYVLIMRGNSKLHRTFAYKIRVRYAASKIFQVYAFHDTLYAFLILHIVLKIIETMSFCCKMSCLIKKNSVAFNSDLSTSFTIYDDTAIAASILNVNKC